MRNWKLSDYAAFRKLLDAMIPAAIQDVLGHPIAHRVLSSTIIHSPLEPEGATFTINFSIQVNEKKAAPNDPGISK